MSVRTELEKLSRLQDLDLKIDRARKLVSLAPQAFAQLEKELNAEKANLEKATAGKADMEKQKRQLETENFMDQDRIKNIDARLGGVTNNKEFHAASKEGDKARKLIGDREKAVTDLNQRITAADTQLAEIQARVDALNAQLETKKAEVGDQAAEADKEISAYAGDRNAMVSEIEAPLMSRYTRIRKVYSDAVAAVNNGHCVSCNVSLPPQLYIQVQKGNDLITCPSCQRILFYRVQ